MAIVRYYRHYKALGVLLVGDCQHCLNIDTYLCSHGGVFGVCCCRKKCSLMFLTWVAIEASDSFNAVIYLSLGSSQHMGHKTSIQVGEF